MQNPISTLPNNEIKEESKQLEDVLKALPSELLGVIPESVWLNLSLDQKKEILRQHNLLDKYNTVETAQAPVETLPVEITQQETSVPDVIVEQENKIEEIRTPEFTQALEEAREIENSASKELPVEDKVRVEEETAANQNTAKASWSSKVFGYTVSEDTSKRSEEISSTGNIEDGRTWAATLLRKILEFLG